MAIKNQIELERISKPKYFDKDEYVCYEGQLGKEMYVVLRGSIGVFITGVLGNLTKVATIGEGQFFGEMAI
ncbi:MAG: cyclic nucleotide-binding domain-containing protein, partial [Ruminococcaceae bacterium]|nr:cyclic nucleotide-binding domain-containing protein [Oscillospiraceae bacterium]